MCKRYAVLAAALLLTAIMLSGCGALKDEEEHLNIAAAASMRFVLEEAAAVYRQHRGEELRLIFGSSGDLARQIAAGAPVDLYISADRAYVRQLLEEGHLEAGTEAVYALGRLALAYHREAVVAPSSLVDLPATAGKIALANPGHAPYGRAAREALEAAGVWDDLQDRLVYGENALQVLQFVQTGNAPLAIIPLALVLTRSPDIEHILIDSSLHSPLEQSLAVVAGSPRAEAAAEFAAFLTGPEGKAILERHGFTAP